MCDCPRCCRELCPLSPQPTWDLWLHWPSQGMLLAGKGCKKYRGSSGTSPGRGLGGCLWPAGPGAADSGLSSSSWGTGGAQPSSAHTLLSLPGLAPSASHHLLHTPALPSKKSQASPFLECFPSTRCSNHLQRAKAELAPFQALWHPGSVNSSPAKGVSWEKRLFMSIPQAPLPQKPSSMSLSQL